MSTVLQSVEDLRDTVRASIDEREAEGLPCPTVVWNGDPACTYGRLRAKTESAGSEELRATIAAFNFIEGNDARELAKRERWSQDDERAATKHIMSEEEEAERQAMLQEAADKAEYARSTEGRLERIETLLGRIASALEKR